MRSVPKCVLTNWWPSNLSGGDCKTKLKTLYKRWVLVPCGAVLMWGFQQEQWCSFLLLTAREFLSISPASQTICVLFSASGASLVVPEQFSRGKKQSLQQVASGLPAATLELEQILTTFFIILKSCEWLNFFETLFFDSEIFSFYPCQSIWEMRWI